MLNFRDFPVKTPDEWCSIAASLNRLDCVGCVSSGVTVYLPASDNWQEYCSSLSGLGVRGLVVWVVCVKW